MKYKILNISNLLGLFFVIISLLVTAILITPTLHYHLQQTAFIPQYSFFKNYIDYPGGMADLMAQFVAQFFNYNIFGSFLIVGIACIQALLILSIIRNLKIFVKTELLIFSLAVLFALLVLTNYYYPYYASIRLLILTFFVWGYSKVNWESKIKKLIFWILLAFFLFFISGGFALIVFSISTLFIYLIKNEKKLIIWYIPAIIIFAAFLPYLSYKLIFPLNIENLYRITLFKPPAMLAYTPDFSIYIYYLFLPFLLGFAFLSYSFFDNVRFFKRLDSFSGRRTKFFVMLQFILSLLLGFFLFVISFNSVKKNILLIDYYAEHEEWENVLRTASKIPLYDIRVNYQVNRAFSKQGVLADKLFEYPQIMGSQGLFVDEVLDLTASMPISDLYFDLGFMAESQHWAFEAQTLLPESPRILKRLVLINLVNRDYDLAQKFLTILDENMLYHNWVDTYKKYVKNPKLTDNDKIISDKRQYSPARTEINSGSIEWMKLLFETNPKNKLAYEYLMCNLILDSRLNEFMTYLPYARRFKYGELPKSWQEAACYYYASTNTKPENYVSENCIKAFTALNNELKPFKNNLQAGKSVVHKNFSKTYWYYLLYISPFIKKELQQK